MWKNIVQLGRPHMITWRMRIACLILKATNTSPEYVIIIASQLQELVLGRSSMLGYTYVVCLI